MGEGGTGPCVCAWSCVQRIISGLSSAGNEAHWEQSCCGRTRARVPEQGWLHPPPPGTAARERGHACKHQHTLTYTSHTYPFTYSHITHFSTQIPMCSFTHTQRSSFDLQGATLFFFFFFLDFRATPAAYGRFQEIRATTVISLCLSHGSSGS